VNCLHSRAGALSKLDISGVGSSMGLLKQDERGFLETREGTDGFSKGDDNPKPFLYYPDLAQRIALNPALLRQSMILPEAKVCAALAIVVAMLVV